MRHLVQVREHGDGFLRADRVKEDVWPLGEGASEVHGMSLVQKGEVGGEQVGRRDGGFADDGAETCMGVLQVRTCVALEAGHLVAVVLVVVDSVIR